MTVRPGTVYLVGAGPGDPGLITVRGLELLQRADVVLHDRLVEPALLEQARPIARLIDVGKMPYGAATEQATINAALVRHAREGSVVVRLKGGDPLVFGRGWEERQACVDSGVPCEIVPGVSSAIAGPAAAAIPVTLRGVASSVAIVAAPAIDDRALQGAACADTSVFLMGVRGLRDLAQRLVRAGRDPSTPAAVVERATLPGERVVRAPLRNIAEAARLAGVESPAVVVVGEVAALGTPTPGPLTGRRIVVTRPRQASQELCGALRTLGADVVFAPLIQLALTNASGHGVFDRLGAFDWLVFGSRHGVRGFRRALETRQFDLRRLPGTRIAAIGPVVARELEAWGVHVDLLPQRARAEGLVQSLLASEAPPRRVLFPCGTLAVDDLSAALGAAGITVERVPVYETRRLPLDPRARAVISEGVDAILLASPSAATALGDSNVDPGHAAIICIGPTTAAATAPFGWQNVRVAESHSDAGLVACAMDAVRERSVR